MRVTKLVLASFALWLVVSVPARASMIITPTYNDAAMSSAGLTAGQIPSVHTAFGLAAAQFTSNFTDPIHINIAVTATSTAGFLGGSSTNLHVDLYSAIHTALVADASSADDTAAVISATGSAFTASDPIGTAHTWLTSRAEAKSLGLIGDDLTNDGTFTFGSGFTYDFDPSDGITAGAIDFQGVAMHEISEIMGRIPGLGAFSIAGSPAYMLYDLFRYTGAGTRGLTNGSGIDFSIDAGTTLLKAYNFPNGNGSDPQDWASGANDSFNAFAAFSTVEPLTAVDLRVMDVIGYNRISAVPEPATGLLLVTALMAGAFFRRRATHLK